MKRSYDSELYILALGQFEKNNIKIMGWRHLLKVFKSNLHLMKSQRLSGGFSYNSFIVFGALDNFEKTGPTNTLLKVAKS